MRTIPVTQAMRELALHAIRTKKLSKVGLAKAVDNGKPWVTKFFDGSLKSIKDKDLIAMEEYLDVRFFGVEIVEREPSHLAQRISSLVDTDADFAKIAMVIDEMLTRPRPAFIPMVPSEDMSRIGQEIIRICFANEDKPGKVAKLVIELLSDPKMKRHD